MTVIKKSYNNIVFEVDQCLNIILLKICWHNKQAFRCLLPPTGDNLLPTQDTVLSNEFHFNFSLNKLFHVKLHYCSCSNPQLFSMPLFLTSPEAVPCILCVDNKLKNLWITIQLLYNKRQSQASPSFQAWFIENTPNLYSTNQYFSIILTSLIFASGY